MKWIIERKDKKVEEANVIFSEELNYNPSFERIYFSWAGHACGFMYNGNFFVDNIIYDFKIKINEMKTFQNKTVAINIINNKEKIVSWNIGYMNIGLNDEKYFMTIYPDGKIIFNAEKNGIRREINIK